MDTLDDVPARLMNLRSRDCFSRVFCAEFHQFELNPCLTGAAVAEFESRHRVALPKDYRHFILHIGDGGAGPDYGVHRLGMDGGNQPWKQGDWTVGDFAEPFPHTYEWNALPFDPDDKDACDLISNEAEAEYFDPKHVNGAIPICHRGCNLRYWLVLTGPEAGHIWYDRRVEWGGLTPVRIRSKMRVTFAQWYLNWLDDAVRKILLG